MPGKPTNRSVRKIEIAVGLQWPKGIPANRKYALAEPWPTIHALLKRAAAAARPVSGRPIMIRRLKLKTGMSAKDGVIQSIRDADILVFDICPTKAQTGAAKCPPNVLLEIGIALGMEKPTILICGGKYRPGRLPSDMAGQAIATYRRPGSRNPSKHSAGIDEKSIIAAVVKFASRL